MREDLKILEEQFPSKTSVVARVRPDGFAIESKTVPAIRGVVSSWRLVRKCFQGRRLVCLSNDGTQSANGKTCEDCPERTSCTPAIRLRLEAVTAPPIASSVSLDLSYTSSRNFTAYARHLASVQIDLPDIPTLLTIVHRDHWGEVCFASDPDPIPPSDRL